jgi:PilZ domain
MATTPNRTDLLPEEPADSERRTSTRYGFGAAALIRLYLPGRDEQMYGCLHDLSATGIAFDLLGAVECGEMVVAKLRTAETTRVEVQAEVVHATAAHGLCRVGCRLAEPMDPDVLHAILRQARRHRAQST